MALRYLIIPSSGDQGPSGIADAVGRSLGWSSREVGGNALFTSDARAILPLPAHDGVVLGTLFQRGAASRPVLTIADWQGQHLDDPIDALLHRYWGGYLAIVPRAGRLAVLRDPSGAIPCLMARVAGEPV